MATALSYLDRQALSIAAPLVRREMHLDNAQLGLLLSAFFYAYSAGHLIVGWALDRFPIRTTYAVFVGLWSVSQSLSGLAGGFGSLFAARMALGGFEAAAQPGAARIIAAALSQRDRSLANGIMMSGGSLGAILAPPFMIWLANVCGWRYGFLVIGAMGLVWSVSWLIWARLPVESSHPHHDLFDRRQEPWREILRSGRFWACTAGALFATPIIHISSSWIPTYFVQQWGLQLNAGFGLYLLIVYLGLDLGFLLGGASVSMLIRNGWSVVRSRKWVLVAATACMLAAVAVPFAPTPIWAVVLVFLLNFGRAAYGANYLAFNQEIAPHRVGTMAGIMGAIGAFSGAVLVWLVGILSQASGFRLPFLMVGALAVLGLLPILFVSWDKTSHVSSSAH
jgi:ACS family hexuronate transporter-like MFS transporter